MITNQDGALQESPTRTHLNESLEGSGSFTCTESPMSATAPSAEEGLRYAVRVTLPVRPAVPRSRAPNHGLRRTLSSVGHQSHGRSLQAPQRLSRYKMADRSPSGQAGAGRKNHWSNQSADAAGQGTMPPGEAVAPPPTALSGTPPVAGDTRGSIERGAPRDTVPRSGGRGAEGQHGSLRVTPTQGPPRAHQTHAGKSQ